jgi:hypothetical protein
MYNPRILEAFEMYERMTKNHAEELYRSRLLWKEFKDKDGNVLQLVPVADLLFKF